MALTERQQVLERLRTAERPLIAFRKDWNPDAAASAVALASVLTGLGKRPEIACDGFAPGERLAFLPGAMRVRPELAGMRRFVISIDTSKQKVGELSYESKDGALHIYLTPKAGSLDVRHVTMRSAEYHHDLIVTVDTPDLASLGGLRDQAPEFFFQTPIVNIDHDAGNESYGQTNLVDPTAVSTSEIVYGLAKELGRPLDEELATALLTGIVAKTRSFKAGGVTPRALVAASEFVAAGARREQVVASLYRTKTVPTLRLWGRALARMKSEPSLKLVWTVLTKQDFVLAGAAESALPDVIDDLIVNAPEAETIALLYEHGEGEICCLLRSDARRDADRLMAPWGGEGGRTQMRCFLKGKPMVEAEKEVLARLREELAKPRT